MTELPKPTENRAKPSKRRDLRAWLDQHPGVVGEAEYRDLAEALAPVSENYLHRLLRDSGAPLSPLVAGVRQGDFDELEASLLALLDEYEQGDSQRRKAIRKRIISAKDHARWAATRGGSGASNKGEMILWMITWLENPPIFRHWVELRRSNSKP